MRLLRGQVPVVLDPEHYQFEIGKAKMLTEGGDVAIISTGLMTGRALDAAKALDAEGIRASVLHLSTLKPFDRETVEALIGRVPAVVTAENHMQHGGLAIPDCFCDSGSLPYLVDRYSMGATHIAQAAREALH
jgi:transketolase